MTKPTVGGDLVVEGMAASAYLQVRCAPWVQMACTAIEPHCRVGLMRELANFGGKEFRR